MSNAALLGQEASQRRAARQAAVALPQGLVNGLPGETEGRPGHAAGIRSGPVVRPLPMGVRPSEDLGDR